MKKDGRENIETQFGHQSINLLNVYTDTCVSGHVEKYKSLNSVFKTVSVRYLLIPTSLINLRIPGDLILTDYMSREIPFVTRVPHLRVKNARNRLSRSTQHKPKSLC